MNIVCIVGLPGSGKTFLAYQLAKDIDDCCIIDDIQSLDQLTNIKTHYLIITDPYFCFDSVRFSAQRILEKRGNVSWIFFENMPFKSLKNVDLRNDGRKVRELTHLLSKNYRIPKGYIPKEIWNKQ